MGYYDSTGLWRPYHDLIGVMGPCYPSKGLYLIVHSNCGFNTQKDPMMESSFMHSQMIHQNSCGGAFVSHPSLPNSFADGAADDLYTKRKPPDQLHSNQQFTGHLLDSLDTSQPEKTSQGTETPFRSVNTKRKNLIKLCDSVKQTMSNGSCKDPNRNNDDRNDDVFETFNDSEEVQLRKTDGAADAMTEAIRCALRMHMLEIIDTISPDDIVDRLMTQDDSDTIRASWTNRDRAIKLMQILLTRGENCLMKFMEILQYQYPHVYKKVIMTKSKNPQQDHDNENQLDRRKDGQKFENKGSWNSDTVVSETSACPQNEFKSLCGQFSTEIEIDHEHNITTNSFKKDNTSVHSINIYVNQLKGGENCIKYDESQIRSDKDQSSATENHNKPDEDQIKQCENVFSPDVTLNELDEYHTSSVEDLCKNMKSYLMEECLKRLSMLYEKLYKSFMDRHVTDELLTYHFHTAEELPERIGPHSISHFEEDGYCVYMSDKIQGTGCNIIILSSTINSAFDNKAGEKFKSISECHDHDKDQANSEIVDQQEIIDNAWEPSKPQNDNKRSRYRDFLLSDLFGQFQMKYLCSELDKAASSVNKLLEELCSLFKGESDLDKPLKRCVKQHQKSKEPKGSSFRTVKHRNHMRNIKKKHLKTRQETEKQPIPHQEPMLSVCEKSQIVKKLVKISSKMPDARKCQQTLIKVCCSDPFMRKELMKCMRMKRDIRNFELTRLLVFRLRAPQLMVQERNLRTFVDQPVFNTILQVMFSGHNKHVRGRRGKEVISCRMEMQADFHQAGLEDSEDLSGTFNDENLGYKAKTHTIDMNHQSADPTYVFEKKDNVGEHSKAETDQTELQLQDVESCWLLWILLFCAKIMLPNSAPNNKDSAETDLEPPGECDKDTCLKQLLVPSEHIETVKRAQKHSIIRQLFSLFMNKYMLTDIGTAALNWKKNLSKYVSKDIFDSELTYSKEINSPYRVIEDLFRFRYFQLTTYILFPTSPQHHLNDPFGGVNMKYELHRFRSFGSGYTGKGWAIQLARNGFYSNPELGLDTVQCFYCGMRYCDRESIEEEHLAEIHRTVSPHCAHVASNNDLSGNIPIKPTTNSASEVVPVMSFTRHAFTNEPQYATSFFMKSRGQSPIDVPVMPTNAGTSFTHQVFSTESEYPASASMTCGARSSGFLGQHFEISTSRLAASSNQFREQLNSDYTMQENRERSFAIRPSCYNTDPVKLAEAGFYYVGQGDDKTRCFTCGGEIVAWKEGDDPWEVHAGWFPECTYVLECKDQSYVDRAYAQRLQQEDFEDQRSVIAEPEQVVDPISDPRTWNDAKIMMEAGFNEDDVRKAIIYLWRKTGKFKVNRDELSNLLLDMQDEEKCKSAQCRPNAGRRISSERAHSVERRPDETNLKTTASCRCNTEQTSVKTSNGAFSIVFHDTGNRHSQLPPAGGNSHQAQSNGSTSLTLPAAPDTGTLPKHPVYSDTSARLRSFSPWPSDTVQRPEQLADAGFYYTGPSDIVRCFYCGIGLRKWDEEDNPWFEHARFSPSCNFLIISKGKAFIQEAQRVHGNRKDEGGDTGIASGEKRLGMRNSNESNVTHNTCVTYPCASLQSASACSVLEMGYSASIVQQAMHILQEETENTDPTAYQIMEKVFDLEEGSATAVTQEVHDVTNGAASSHIHVVDHEESPAEAWNGRDRSIDLQTTCDNTEAQRAGAGNGKTRLPYIVAEAQGAGAGNGKTRLPYIVAEAQGAGTGNGKTRQPVVAGPCSTVSEQEPVPNKTTDRELEVLDSAVAGMHLRNLTTSEEREIEQTKEEGASEQCQDVMGEASSVTGGHECTEIEEQETDFQPPVDVISETTSDTVDPVLHVEVSDKDSAQDGAIGGVVNVTNAEVVGSSQNEEMGAKTKKQSRTGKRSKRNKKKQRNAESIPTPPINQQLPGMESQAEMAKKIYDTWVQIGEVKQKVEEVQTQKESSIQAENDKLKELTRCKICYEKDVAVLFLPCGHQVTCEECAKKVKNCPICRQAIKTCVKTFLS